LDKILQLSINNIEFYAMKVNKNHELPANL
jgi:hypothetical protein